MSESITNLADAVAALGALPMPVGPAPQPMSAEQISAITTLADAATPGPWWTDSLTEHDGSVSIGIDAGGDNWIVPCQDLGPADAEFIAHARTDVQALLADNALLRARVTELEAARQADHETWQHDLRTARDERETTAARIAELEALTPAAIQTCRVCGAGYSYGQPCSTCVFKARMAAEVAAQALREDPHDGPLTHSYRVPRDLPEPGGA